MGIQASGRLVHVDPLYSLLDKSKRHIHVGARQDDTKGQKDSLYYRLREGFIETGMPSGKDVLWRRVLKLGARKGDTWDGSSKSQQGLSPGDSAKCTVTNIFVFNGASCAVIETEMTLRVTSGNPMHFKNTTWYLRGKGDIRQENRQVSESGNESVLWREEMVLFFD
jgi:hypothetical protein